MQTTNLLRCADCGRAGRRGWSDVLVGEVAVIVERAIELAAQLGSLRSECRAATFQEDDGHNAAELRVRVGSKPAVARAGVVRVRPADRVSQIPGSNDGRGSC